MAAREDRIALLLTDLVLPGMLGHAPADRLRELQPDIEVLYMSGFSEVVLERSAPVAPAALVDKPFTGPALLQRVAQALAPS